MLAPEVETLPWAEQLAIDDAAYREQLALPLRALGVLPREARGRGLRIGRGDRWAGRHRARCRSPTRASCASATTPENPIGEHLCATRDEIVRVYSTSGTTGTPSFVPLTAGDLDNWITASARSYAASGISAGERIVSTYNAGPFVAGAALASFDRIGLCHVPRRHRQQRAAHALDRPARPEAAVLTPSYAAHLIEWAAERDIDLAASSVQRVLVAGEPGGGEPAFREKLEAGWGARVTEAHGHRRHRRLAVGRVRAAGRDAPRARAASSTPS